MIPSTPGGREAKKSAPVISFFQRNNWMINNDLASWQVAYACGQRTALDLGRKQVARWMIA